LFAVPFDLSRLEVKGVPVPVVEGIKINSRSGAANFSFSNGGSLAYVSGKSDTSAHELVWVDRRGEARPIMDAKHLYLTPSLSPDGQRLAMCIVGVTQNIWVYDIARGTLTRLSYEQDWGPIWLPDGSRIAYTSNRAGMKPGIAWMPADGSGEPEQLVKREGPEVGLASTGSFSPDGKVLAYTDGFAEGVVPRRSTGLDIWLLRVDGEREAVPFLRTQFDEFGPEFSPDGRWLAYVSNESGRSEVYVAAYPGPGAKHQISTEGGTSPRWARSGKELFYRNGRKMMMVAVSLEPEFNASTPRALFEGEYIDIGAPSFVHPNYDVTPDGQRFVMLKPYEAPSAPSQLIVALEWFDDLGRRVPAKGHP
jgi:serine/threonine-protein kinase